MQLCSRCRPNTRFPLTKLVVPKGERLHPQHLQKVRRDLRAVACVDAVPQGPRQLVASMQH